MSGSRAKKLAKAFRYFGPWWLEQRAWRVFKKAYYQHTVGFPKVRPLLRKKRSKNATDTNKQS